VKIKCPIPQCGQENLLDAAHCSSCGTNLQAYSRLLLMPDDLFNRALAFSQGGHFQQAEQYLQSALLFNPRDWEALLLLAQLQTLQGNTVAATETFARVMEKASNDPRLNSIAMALQPSIEPAPMDPTPLRVVVAPSQPAKPSFGDQANRRKRKKKRH
jgi:tetratricopeptide (TPR) repeat protein